MIPASNLAFPQGTATRRHALWFSAVGRIFPSGLTLRHLLGRDTVWFGMAGDDCLNALAVKAMATKDKARRCGIVRDLLPLFDRQLAIAETCKADDPTALEAARTNVSRKKAHFQQDCGS